MKIRWTILSLVLISVVLTGCVGIPQRVIDSERPGYWKCTATDIAAGIYYFPVYTVPALIDLPFGFVVDVVFLPFDAHNTRKQEADRAFWLEYFDRGLPLSSTQDGLARLSFLGRETVEKRIALSSPPLNRRQLADLIAVGFAIRVAESQRLDEELILSSIGMTNVLSDEYLAQRVAGNPGTPLSVLDRMVTANVALPQLVGNPSLTVELINQIADAARSNMAMKPNGFCGPISWRSLLAHAHAALARHPSTSPETLESLYTAALTTPKQGWSNDGEFIIAVIAKNRATPPDVLLRIVHENPNPYMKKLATENLTSRGIPVEDKP